MKKLIFLLTVLFSLGALNDAEASHIAGGDITYRYIGDVTGIPFDYEVTVRVYRDTEGIPFDSPNITLKVTSSCFNEQNFPLNRIPFPANPNDANGGGYVEGYENCGDTNSVDSLRFVQFLYKDTITLPGLCTDYVFSYETPCCRNSEIDNLSNLGTSILIRAKLNNTLGPNNSAQFNTGAVKLFCKNRRFQWSQGAGDPDINDLLIFSLANPLDGPAPDGTPIGYNAGYSVDQPMTTVNGFNLDSLTGVVTFTPAKEEFIVFKMIVQDFRYDPNLNDTVTVGEVMREIQIPVVNECGSEQSFETGPRVNLNVPGQSVSNEPVGNLFNFLNGFNIDTIGNPPPTVNGVVDLTTRKVPVITSYSCFDSTIVIQFDPKFQPQCSSIHPTDFRVIGPDSVLRPVVSVEKFCDDFVGQTSTEKVELILEKPFDENGRYILYTKRGNDGNILIDECGFELGEFFVYFIDVNNCPPLIYNMENVSVEYDKEIHIDWTVNPDYFAAGARRVFDSWGILKRNVSANGDYYPQEYLEDYTLRSWIDTVVNPEDVDATVYEYAVQMIRNGEALSPTPNGTNSVLLENELINPDQLQFDWNNYNGWPNAEFDFYYGQYDSAGQSFDWVKIDSNNVTFTYTFTISDFIGANDSSLFAFKVEAVSNDPTIIYTSESNWLYIDYRPEVEEPVEEPVVLGTPYIPNVFTPNSDGFGDTFWISLEEKGDPGYRLHDQISVEVYNRWGHLVFENANFDEVNTPDEGWDGTDINSGQKLADGVYYYIINMKDAEYFTESNYKGHITIFKNGQ